MNVRSYIHFQKGTFTLHPDVNLGRLKFGGRYWDRNDYMEVDLNANNQTGTLPRLSG